MRTTVLLLAATAITSASAALNLENPMSTLNRRQAFDPDETTSTGANCVDAFGPGYVECVPEKDFEPRLCINPSEGEICCENKWGCPAESFCLVQDLCCPEGTDPASCASQNGVNLPPNFVKTTAAPIAATATAEASASASDVGYDDVFSSSDDVGGFYTTEKTAGVTGLETSATSTALFGGQTTATTTRASATTSKAVLSGAGQERVGFVAAVLGAVAALVL
ncbi:hypothetical protein B0H67DRAFT_550758 [Lasiosphaeris hirsuta]|uniref:GPI anchored serine-threonine rich protein n=1 Tax=Lasiosphaeris hirsuta TaxID=260670 RepID=A0AA40E7C4_9PEZI|nr:hypothetical protein B0H67DRAFT_550758 [Lasiosphaeris hirsuta]